MCQRGSKRKERKNAAKTKVLESFPRAKCCLHRFPSAARMGTSKFHSLLSHCLCVYSRWPLTRARAALTQQGNTLRLPCYAQHFLSSFRRGRCLHRSLPYSLSPVGRDDHTSLPGITPQLMKNPVIARALRARLRTADSNRLSLKWRAPIASVAALIERLVGDNSTAEGHWCTTAPA